MTISISEPSREDVERLVAFLRAFPEDGQFVDPEDDVLEGLKDVTLFGLVEVMPQTQRCPTCGRGSPQPRRWYITAPGRALLALAEEKEA
jgi:hypothetical protein